MTRKQQQKADRLFIAIGRLEGKALGMKQIQPEHREHWQRVAEQLNDAWQILIHTGVVMP